MIDLSKIQGIVYASSYEKECLYNMCSKEGITWEGDAMGYGKCIGDIGGRPVNISLSRASVGGVEVLFIEDTSIIVDWQMIEDWHKKEMPDIPRQYAENFINLIWK